MVFKSSFDSLAHWIISDNEDSYTFYKTYKVREEDMMMKERSVRGIIAIIVVMGMVGLTALVYNKATADELAPKAIVATPFVKMGSKVNVVVMGTGFKPGEEVRLLFTSADGVQADIGYALKPAPKANKIGSWVTVWNASRYVKRKIIKGGAYTITVVDSDYNVLTHAPVAFYQEPKKKKKK